MIRLFRKIYCKRNHIPYKIHNTHCVYWMPIPNIPKELKLK